LQFGVEKLAPGLGFEPETFDLGSQSPVNELSATAHKYWHTGQL